MQRVTKGASATVTGVFLDADGRPVDPSPATATVAVRRDDGTQVASGAATRVEAGVFSFTLTPAHTAELDRLVASWESALGVVETIVEVCGGVFFTIAEARRVRPLGDEADFPPSAIASARTLVEQALEDACGGIAFVPRFAVETIDGEGGRSLLLGRSRIHRVRSLHLDGQALAPDEIAEIETSRTGRLRRRTPWPRGLGSIRVAYEHGYATVPLRVARAALLQTRRWLEESPIDERATELRTDGGVVLLAGGDGLDFDIPEVNAVVERYGMPHVA